MPRTWMSTQRIFWIIIIVALMIWEGVVLYYLWVLKLEPSSRGADGTPQLSLSDSSFPSNETSLSVLVRNSLSSHVPQTLSRSLLTLEFEGQLKAKDPSGEWVISEGGDDLVFQAPASVLVATAEGGQTVTANQVSLGETVRVWVGFPDLSVAAVSGGDLRDFEILKVEVLR